MQTKTLCLMLLCLIPGCRTAPTESLEHEREQIREAVEIREAQYSEALRTRDPELIVRMYAHDALVISPDEPVLAKADLLEYYSNYLLLNPSLEATVEFLDVSPSLEMAYELGRITEEYDTPAGRIRRHSRYLNVWRKVGGSWQVAAEATVYDSDDGELLYGIDPSAHTDTLVQHVADSLAQLRLRPRAWPPIRRDTAGPGQQ